MHADAEWSSTSATATGSGSPPDQAAARAWKRAEGRAAGERDRSSIRCAHVNPSSFLTVTCTRHQQARARRAAAVILLGWRSVAGWPRDRSRAAVRRTRPHHL